MIPPRTVHLEGGCSETHLAGHLKRVGHHGKSRYGSVPRLYYKNQFPMIWLQWHVSNWRTGQLGTWLVFGLITPGVHAISDR
jgi:hypothetical protein